jgi:poly(A) polymerase
LRRLSALLPRDPVLAEDIAVRLRFSNKARKRLSCSAIADLGGSPRALAYDVATDCAVDRLLLAGKVDEAAEVASWKAPRLPISGGALIARGLSEGPIVARTLKAIDRRWVAEGFPTGEKFEKIVSDELRNAR